MSLDYILFKMDLEEVAVYREQMNCINSGKPKDYYDSEKSITVIRNGQEIKGPIRTGKIKKGAQC